MPNPGARIAFLALVSTAASANAQRVWVVAPVPGQGVHFTDIQPAIDAASDGDVVLVRAGIYPAFRIDGKSIVVAGDDPAPIALAQTATGVSVSNIAAGQSVVVRRFALTSFASGALYVNTCLGPVTFEECAFSLPFPLSGYAATVFGAARLTLIRCTLAGGTGRFPTRGLTAFSSGLFLHGCTVSGGSGSTASVFPGAEAAWLSGSTLSAAGSTFAGGWGGPGMSIGGFCIPPQRGGDAITLSDAASTAYLLDDVLTPGQAGAPAPGCPPASSGQPVGGAGTARFLSGRMGVLTSTSPVRAGQTLTLGLSGPPGFGTWLAASTAQAPTLVLGCNGGFHPWFAGLVVLFLGAMPASGSMSLSVPLPVQVPLQGAPVFLQMATTDPSVGCVVGSPTAVLLLDSRF